MAWTQWWGYRKGMVESDKDDFGVYELADESQNTVYYGSGHVKTRLLDHLNKQECPKAKQYRIEYSTCEKDCRAREEQLLEAYKRAYGKLPMYNEKII